MRRDAFPRGRRAAHVALAAAMLGLTACGTGSDSGEVTMKHYFDVGGGHFDRIGALCDAQSGERTKIDPVEQEAYKDSIQVQLAGGSPPDVFSYWAGAKTQYLVDQERLTPLDDVWEQYGLDRSVPKSLADASADYDGHKYLVPFDYHYVGMFYNPKALAKAGITETPRTWDELMDAAAKLKSVGITPFALGAKAQWPAQFWFDYLLLRTAGPEYREKLMTGRASYTDPQVKKAFGMWRDLFDKGYFNRSANGVDWPDAADQVAKGEAAMTLNGTWITGYWDGNKISPGKGYDMFPFPEVTPGVPQAALGPVDGWAVGTGAAHPTEAKKVLGCLAGPRAQEIMAEGEGALPPNRNADISQRNSVVRKAAKEVEDSSTFVFNYDLATPPEMSDEGLNAIAKFVHDPSTLEQNLKDAQAASERTFQK
ncbi:extracellular solute-binding protein [Streptomyces sp. AJS327]|uniref:ABC transporter substrate-binding protein n=1 Tax=Streptomyces sp. AJS327 TaxID=2545265 RepID=UPI0015DDA877|nr:extracellular solute-binding protein [Streptomyces sp. AJS327]MBA0051274.1 extracellular solute-binding protein [Streptomyces sp. AJS327]